MRIEKSARFDLYLDRREATRLVADIVAALALDEGGMGVSVSVGRAITVEPLSRRTP